MGWKSKLLALFLGLAFFGVGAWPLGLLCFLYLVFTLRPKGTSSGGGGFGPRLIPRLSAAGALFILAAIALGSGGTLSPLVFSLAGAVVLMWPSLIRRLPLSGLVPVRDSILLKSKFLPFRWYAIAEVKPGPDPFPMAAAAFSGTLFAFTDTGRTYCTVSCRASNRKDAEARLLCDFRSAAPAGRAGAYLLPLDSKGAADLLRIRLSPLKLPKAGFPSSLAHLSGLVFFECGRGRVNRASAYAVEGPAKTPLLPVRPDELEASPLTWEIFDAIGRRTHWPEPDRYSDLLDSMLATKGAPFAERLRSLEATGDELRVGPLGGESVSTTRPQLRAIVSIYS